jgi:predicted transcriptional regulator
MTASSLKESLIHIAEKVDTSTSLEDVFKELSLIADIEESEQQEEMGETVSHDEVKALAKQWVK